MPRVPVPDDVAAVLAKPYFAVVATLLPDGSPHSVPVWTDMEGERIVFFTHRARRATSSATRAPR